MKKRGSGRRGRLRGGRFQPPPPTTAEVSHDHSPRDDGDIINRHRDSTRDTRNNRSRHGDSARDFKVNSSKNGDSNVNTENMKVEPIPAKEYSVSKSDQASDSSSNSDSSPSESDVSPSKNKFLSLFTFRSPKGQKSRPESESRFASSRQLNDSKMNSLQNNYSNAPRTSTEPQGHTPERQMRRTKSFSGSRGIPRRRRGSMSRYSSKRRHGDTPGQSMNISDETEITSVYPNDHVVHTGYTPPTTRSIASTNLRSHAPDSRSEVRVELNKVKNENEDELPRTPDNFPKKMKKKSGKKRLDNFENAENIESNRKPQINKSSRIAKNTSANIPSKYIREMDYRYAKPLPLAKEPDETKEELPIDANIDMEQFHQKNFKLNESASRVDDHHIHSLNKEHSHEHRRSRKRNKETPAKRNDNHSGIEGTCETKKPIIDIKNADNMNYDSSIVDKQSLVRRRSYEKMVKSFSSDLREKCDSTKSDHSLNHSYQSNSDLPTIPDTSTRPKSDILGTKSKYIHKKYDQPSDIQKTPFLSEVSSITSKNKRNKSGKNSETRKLNEFIVHDNQSDKYEIHEKEKSNDSGAKYEANLVKLKEQRSHRKQNNIRNSSQNDTENNKSLNMQRNSKLALVDIPTTSPYRSLLKKAISKDFENEININEGFQSPPASSPVDAYIPMMKRSKSTSLILVKSPKPGTDQEIQIQRQMTRLRSRSTSRGDLSGRASSRCSRQEEDLLDHRPLYRHRSVPLAVLNYVVNEPWQETLSTIQRQNRLSKEILLDHKQSETENRNDCENYFQETDYKSQTSVRKSITGGNHFESGSNIKKSQFYDNGTRSSEVENKQEERVKHRKSRVGKKEINREEYIVHISAEEQPSKQDKSIYPHTVNTKTLDKIFPKNDGLRDDKLSYRKKSKSYSSVSKKERKRDSEFYASAIVLEDNINSKNISEHYRHNEDIYAVPVKKKIRKTRSSSYLKANDSLTDANDDQLASHSAFDRTDKPSRENDETASLYKKTPPKEARQRVSSSCRNAPPNQQPAIKTSNSVRVAATSNSSINNGDSHNSQKHFSTSKVAETENKSYRKNGTKEESRYREINIDKEIEKKQMKNIFTREIEISKLKKAKVDITKEETDGTTSSSTSSEDSSDDEISTPVGEKIKNWFTKLNKKKTLSNRESWNYVSQRNRDNVNHKHDSESTDNAGAYDDDSSESSIGISLTSGKHASSAYNTLEMNKATSNKDLKGREFKKSDLEIRNKPENLQTINHSRDRQQSGNSNRSIESSKVSYRRNSRTGSMDKRYSENILGDTQYGPRRSRHNVDKKIDEQKVMHASDNSISMENIDVPDQITDLKGTNQIIYDSDDGSDSESGSGSSSEPPKTGFKSFIMKLFKIHRSSDSSEETETDSDNSSKVDSSNSHSSQEPRSYFRRTKSETNMSRRTNSMQKQPSNFELDFARTFIQVRDSFKRSFRKSEGSLYPPIKSSREQKVESSASDESLTDGLQRESLGSHSEFSKNIGRKKEERYDSSGITSEESSSDRDDSEQRLKSKLDNTKRKASQSNSLQNNVIVHEIRAKKDQGNLKSTNVNRRENGQTRLKSSNLRNSSSHIESGEIGTMTQWRSQNTLSDSSSSFGHELSDAQNNYDQFDGETFEQSSQISQEATNDYSRGSVISYKSLQNLTEDLENREQNDIIPQSQYDIENSSLELNTKLNFSVNVNSHIDGSRREHINTNANKQTLAGKMEEPNKIQRAALIDKNLEALEIKSNRIESKRAEPASNKLSDKVITSDIKEVSKIVRNSQKSKIDIDIHYDGDVSDLDIAEDFKTTDESNRKVKAFDDLTAHVSVSSPFPVEETSSSKDVQKIYERYCKAHDFENTPHKPAEKSTALSEASKSKDNCFENSTKSAEKKVEQLNNYSSQSILNTEMNKFTNLSENCQVPISKTEDRFIQPKPEMFNSSSTESKTISATNIASIFGDVEPDCTVDRTVDLVSNSELVVPIISVETECDEKVEEMNLLENEQFELLYQSIREDAISDVSNINENNSAVNKQSTSPVVYKLVEDLSWESEDASYPPNTYASELPLNNLQTSEIKIPLIVRDIASKKEENKSQPRRMLIGRRRSRSKSNSRSRSRNQSPTLWDYSLNVIRSRSNSRDGSCSRTTTSRTPSPQSMFLNSQDVDETVNGDGSIRYPASVASSNASSRFKLVPARNVRRTNSGLSLTEPDLSLSDKTNSQKFDSPIKPKDSSLNALTTSKENEKMNTVNDKRMDVQYQEKNNSPLKLFSGVNYISTSSEVKTRVSSTDIFSIGNQVDGKMTKFASQARKVDYSSEKTFENDALKSANETMEIYGVQATVKPSQHSNIRKKTKVPKAMTNKQLIVKSKTSSIISNCDHSRAENDSKRDGTTMLNTAITVPSSVDVEVKSNFEILINEAAIDLTSTSTISTNPFVINDSKCVSQIEFQLKPVSNASSNFGETTKTEIPEKLITPIENNKVISSDFCRLSHKNDNLIAQNIFSGNLSEDTKISNPFSMLLSPRPYKKTFSPAAFHKITTTSLSVPSSEQISEIKPCNSISDTDLIIPIESLPATTSREDAESPSSNSILSNSKTNEWLLSEITTSQLRTPEIEFCDAEEVNNIKYDDMRHEKHVEIKSQVLMDENMLHKMEIEHLKQQLKVNQEHLEVLQRQQNEHLQDSKDNQLSIKQENEDTTTKLQLSEMKCITKDIKSCQNEMAPITERKQFKDAEIIEKISEQGSQAKLDATIISPKITTTSDSITSTSLSLPITGLTHQVPSYVPSYKRYGVRPSSSSLLSKHFAGLSQSKSTEMLIPTTTVKIENFTTASIPSTKLHLETDNRGANSSLIGKNTATSPVTSTRLNLEKHNGLISKPSAAKISSIDNQGTNSTLIGKNKLINFAKEGSAPCHVFPQKENISKLALPTPITIEKVFILSTDSSEDSDTPPPTPPLSPSFFSKNIRKTLHENSMEKFPKTRLTSDPLPPITEISSTLEKRSSSKLLVRRPLAPPPPPPVTPCKDKTSSYSIIPHETFPAPPPPLTMSPFKDGSLSPSSPPPPLPSVPPPFLHEGESDV